MDLDGMSHSCGDVSHLHLLGIILDLDSWFLSLSLHIYSRGVMDAKTQCCSPY